MKLIIQRVKSASVSVSKKKINQINTGVLILLGIENKDTNEDINYLVKKTAELRIFNDNNDNMNFSLKDINGEALVISQFTLCADTKKGRRPSFNNAAKPDLANKMYNLFCEKLQKMNIPTFKGEFGKMMDIKLINNGPVTIILNSK